eukprot:scaffold5444_cov181-Ochromonas_danica.AAC.6
MEGLNWRLAIGQIEQEINNLHCNVVIHGKFLNKFDAMSLSSLDLDESTGAIQGQLPKLEGLNNLYKELNDILNKGFIRQQQFLATVKELLCRGQTLAHALHLPSHKKEKEEVIGGWSQEEEEVDDLLTFESPDPESASYQKQELRVLLRDLYMALTSFSETKLAFLRCTQEIIHCYEETIVGLAEENGVLQVAVKYRLATSTIMTALLEHKFFMTQEEDKMLERVRRLWGRLALGGNTSQVLTEKDLARVARDSQWSKSKSLAGQVGAALVLMLWATSECLYNESASYPVWNFMWGLAMFVWKQSGIDFVQLLQLQGTEVEAAKYPAALVIQSATKRSIIFLLTFIVFNKSVHMAVNGQFSLAYAHTLPVLLGLYFLYIVFNPWEKRKIWLSMVGRVLIAPLSPVIFRDGFIVYAWLCNDIRWTVSTSDRWWSHSQWCHHLVIPLLTLYPLWIRLVQCLRRSVETGHRWPHMVNALKYTSAIIVISFATFQPRLRRDPWWVLSLIGATLFQYSWDLTQDWGMIIFHFPRESRHGSSPLDRCLKCSISLRQKRLLGPSWLYISVMLFNLALRFAWTLTLLPAPEEDDVKSVYATVVSHIGPIVAAAEIVRRMVWGFYRLEFEQIEILQRQPVVVATLPVTELERMDVETSFEGQLSQSHEKQQSYQALDVENGDASPEDWTSFLPSDVIAYIDAMSLSTGWQPKVRFIECVLFAGSVLCAVLLAASPIFFSAHPLQ